MSGKAGIREGILVDVQFDIVEEEELPSLLSNSPVSNGTEQLSALTNPLYQPSPPYFSEVVEEEELLSLSSSTSEEQVIMDPDEAQVVQPSTSATASRNNSNTIRSFKTRVDENGETVYEFASDNEESVISESEEEEVVLQQSLIHVRRSLNPVSNIEPQPSGSGNNRTVSDRAPYINFGDDSDSDTVSSYDSDYWPTPTIRSVASTATTPSVGTRVTGRRGRLPGHVLGLGGSEAVLTHLGTVRQLQVRPVATRKPRKRRRKVIAKKKKPQVSKPKIPKVPKPLAPKIITQDENGNETAASYRSEVSGCHSRTNINFTISAAGEDSYCKVGEVYLQNPEGIETEVLRVLNREMLLSKYPGLKQLTLHVKDSRDLALLQVRTEETLSEEEASQRPKPRLSQLDMRRTLIFVIRKMYLFPCQVEGFAPALFSSKGFGNKNVFRLDYIGFCEESDRIQLDILVNKKTIIGAHDLSEIPYAQHKMLSNIFNSLFNVQLPLEPEDSATGQKKEEDIPWFYGQIKKYHGKEVLPPPSFSLQPEIFGPTLRPYQRDAVHWMLYREGALGTDAQPTDIPTRVNLEAAFFEKMYVPISIGGQSAYYNPHVGYICWTFPNVGEIPSGGILADEMGLGKTVEVICLVLLNPRPIEEYDDEDDCLSSSDYDGSSSNVEESNSGTSSDRDDCDFDAVGRKSRTKSKPNSKSQQLAKRTKMDIICSEPPRISKRMSPSSTRKRNISPCTFLTEGGGSSGDATGSLENKLKLSSFALSVDQPAHGSSNKRNHEDPINSKSEIPKKLLKPSEPTTTYERLKAIYDTELLNYSESGYASRVKFGGTFFHTKIARIARFECLCGGSIDNNRNKVVTCKTCHSSQHANCVGFDKQLSRRFKQRNIDYSCPHCATLEDPYHAKSTLIVTPSTISHQWINELQRHVNKQNMSILFYKGVSNHGYIPPAKLAEFDIVITTYNTLTSELNYVDLPHINSEDGRRFRNGKRFMTIPSPLPCVYWWRVCLDEAQMVEGISTKMSMMAMKLQAVHRWCVTGTPINEGLQDLFGLFGFLAVEPVAFGFWWQKLVQEPFHRKDVSFLYELFGQLIWRMGKKDVLDQLGIPPQTSLVKWLTFSPVEDHFYKQQYEVCSRKILDKIVRLRQTNSNILDSRLAALDRQILNSLLQPFLELRKACCHPQMVKGQSFSLQKGTITMEELLASLIKKTSLQCADDHRQMVASLNGMAGIHMINEKWLDASERYREVLQSAEKNKEHFHTDSLQLLHTLENLADLLDRHHEGVPYTLRDGTLRSDAEELKQKYLEKYANSVKAAQRLVEPLSKLIDELSTEFKCQRLSWWSTALSKAAKLGKLEDLVKRIKDDLISSTGPDQREATYFISLANKFNDAIGLERVLVENILEIEKQRRSALEGLEKMQNENPSSFVHAAVSCHLRKKSELYYKESDELGFRCQLCQYHERFLRYESALFKETRKRKIVRTGRNYQQQKITGEIGFDLTEEERNLVLLQEEKELVESLEHLNVGLSDNLRRGTWGDSDTENILKQINTFARINKLPQDVRDDGINHMKLFDSMKKEFRVLRILWRQVYDQISAHDELSQASTRLCLSYTAGVSQNNDQEPGTSSGSSRRKKNKVVKQLQTHYIVQDQRIQNINVLEIHEVETKMAQMQLEFETGKDSLSIRMGQLLYLGALKKKDYGKKGSVNSEECPVCHCQLGQEWSVLPCGHSYCSDCIKTICPNVLQSFLCPLCRASVKYSDVSFVDAKETDSSSPSKSSTKAKLVKGSHSTKVEAIVETVLQLQESHPNEKCIIFSSWVDVLEIIAKALEQNEVQNCLLNQLGEKFQTELERFKQREDIQVLLMPLTSGSKGLNIIEATHIVLVEPILSLSQELQAIGRIHRIGQTKPTFVHRFYVKNTIEEQLFEVLKTHDVSSDTEGAFTVENLKNLISAGKNYSGPNVVTLD